MFSGVEERTTYLPAATREGCGRRTMLDNTISHERARVQSIHAITSLSEETAVYLARAPLVWVLNLSRKCARAEVSMVLQ